MKRVIITVFLLRIALSSPGLFAQEISWTLGDCVTYAIENTKQTTKNQLNHRVNLVRQVGCAAFIISVQTPSGFGRSIDLFNHITFGDFSSYFLNSSIRSSVVYALNTISANNS
jgi:hypothetical protein